MIQRVHIKKRKYLILFLSLLFLWWEWGKSDVILTTGIASYEDKKETCSLRQLFIF